MAEDKKRVAVLISGNGSNLQALIDACENDEYYPAKIALVISNKADAYGLHRAKEHKIPSVIIPHKNYDSREDFDSALNKELKKYEIDIVCLAGFMRVLSSNFVNDWEGRMINIHPSLLPKHKGSHAVLDALAAGDTVTGCTVHHVVPKIDSGEIIIQKEVVIDPEDTEETLLEKIHEQEHIAYPEALKQLSESL